MQSGAGAGPQQNEQAKSESFPVNRRRGLSSCPIQRWSTQHKAEEKQCKKKKKKQEKGDDKEREGAWEEQPSN